ncbi:NAD(P)-bd_dom domain-containing protein [Pycnococcus provasolii]
MPCSTVMMHKQAVHNSVPARATSLRRSPASCRRTVRSARRTPPPVSATSVAVVGGTGFVGSEVTKQLVAAGCDVKTVSRRGAGDVQGATYVAADALADSKEALVDALKGSDVVVSCVGTIGGDDLAGNGTANVAIVEAAKEAGAKRFVYVSVASIVKDNVKGLGPLDAYFNGKEAAEASVTSTFADNHAIVRPSFIFGGDQFNLTPPRVPTGYGKGVARLLSSGPIRTIANNTPGLIKLTLEPPVDVAAVAGAVVKCVVAEEASARVVDGTEDITKLADE